jgi:2-phosphoglycerate kinase
MSVSVFQRFLGAGFEMSEFMKPDVMKDFQVASMLMQSKINVIVLLAGTSGTGKSTLASLVGARLGI